MPQTGWMNGPRAQILWTFAGGLVGTAIHAMYGTSLQALHMAILCAILMVVSAVDLSIRMIPNACLLLIAAAAAATMVLEASWELALSRIAGGLLGFGIFLIPLLLKSKAGAGDMKFIAVMGLYLGFRHAIVALGILSVLFLFGAAVILIGRKGNLKTAVPMGPYISAAFVAVATMQI